MITTTLNKIRVHHPCKDGWTKLLAYLGKTEADDEPIPFSVIVESNGIADALWCMCSAPEYKKEWRSFAVWCARRVQHKMKDPRSLTALDVAERYANGLATDAELEIARRDAADAAADAADDAADAAYAAAYAAAAYAAADAAAYAAAYAARAEQTAEFLRIVNS